MKRTKNIESGFLRAARRRWELLRVYWRWGAFEKRGKNMKQENYKLESELQCEKRNMETPESTCQWKV